MAFHVNHPFLYLITAIMIAFVIAQSLFFLLRAVKQAKKLGLSTSTVRKTIGSAAVFTLAPAFAILLGVVTLSKMLGLPWPWLRLSVLGALTYELPAATATAGAMGLSTGTAVTDPRAFTAIAWVMTLGIIPGIILVLFGLKKIQKGFGRLANQDDRWGIILMDSLFMGMIAAFVGMLFSKVQLGLPGFVPLVVALVSALLMAVCGALIRLCKASWLEQYALPLSMLGAMAAAIPLTALMR